MMKYCGRSSLKILSLALLAGCCLSAAAAEPSQTPTEPDSLNYDNLQLASLIHSYELLEQEAPILSAKPLTAPRSKYWEFSNEAPEGLTLHAPAVVNLPPITPTPKPTEEIDTFKELESLEDISTKQLGSTPNYEPIASLLPPQAITPPPMPADKNISDIDSLLSAKPQVPAEASTPEDEPDEISDLTSEEQKIIEAVIHDSRSATTGVLTDARINELAKSKIRHGYTLAGRGAYYAARQEFIKVLRMISQSKDAQQGQARQMLALAAGLRALEEAVDFAPRGTQLEADLDIDVICASHRTPVASHLKSTTILPRQMMDCYYRYAQLKLAAAVKGEPAGSMALHALGKLTSRLNKVEPEQHRLAKRKAITFQQAALLAHNQNHLAAHELAVLLADSGHYAEAEQLLVQVVPREPNAVVYRNLARVQEKLGQTRQATANRDFAQQLIRQGASGRTNVNWVSPQNFARTSSNATRYASVVPRPPKPQPTQPPQHYQSTRANWR